MKTLQPVRPAMRMVLQARTAADLMTPNPVSIRHSATVAEAAAFLAARGISAAPVIDEAGRPLGVVSRTDILQHRDDVAAADTSQRPEGTERAAHPKREVPSQAVFRIMTPAVFCIAAEAPAAKAVEKMLALEVGRLFVVDDDGVLIGVISPTDVLRQLRREPDGRNGYGHPDD